MSSEHAATEESVTVGVLGLHSSKETKAILNAAEALGHDTEWLRRENTAVGIEDGTVTVEPAVDVVANRLLLSTSTAPAEEIGLAKTLAGIKPMLNPPEAVTTAMHKFATAVSLAEAGVPVPDALLALSRDRLNAGRDRFGDRAVYKTAIGTHGGGAWLVDLDDPVNPQVGDRQAFLQRFAEAPDGDPRDTRVYVVDGEVVGAMHRHAPEGDWRTNVSLGGDVRDATGDLPSDVVDAALTATEVVGLDYAGVDLIFDGESWVVLEVNPTAGFRGLFQASGTSPGPYIAAAAIDRAGGSIDRAKVETLAESLDDSRPTCMPTKTTSKSVEPAVIGYVEEVLVSGTRGSETVMAKSDTGATRTSIDQQLAADIGTGPIKDVVTVRSGSQKRGKSRPVVDIVVGVGGTQHTVTASVEDRSHMSYEMLLGRDILEHYHVDVTKRADAQPRDAEE
ncbi:RimK/LysX family protein [Halobacteriales archaeon Cl-PHB]